MRYGGVSLTWSCRGEYVLRDPDSGQWRFARDERLPPVSLDEVEVVNAATTPSPNLLVHGDCLLAVNALMPQLLGQVSLIYADPPFNTRNQQLSYEDNLARPLWLSFMEGRLAAAKALLRPGGVIAVHIGSGEQPYLRALLDDVFGHENFISQISWQRAPDRTLLGQGSSLINDCVEYIMLYSNGPVRRDLGAPKKEEPLSWRTLQTYQRVLEVSDDKEPVSEFVDAAGSPVRIFRHSEYRLEPVRADDLKHAFFNSWNKLRSDFPRMARLTNQQQESTFQQALLSRMSLSDTLYSAEYTQSRGKHKGPRTRYYINQKVVLFLRDVAALRGDRVVRVADLNNFWTDEELPATGIAREGGVTLKRGKKPESLLYRIISAFSREGEMVLDPFAGSGTTGAVAHKSGRRWIMVDESCHAVTQITKRMKAVVAGEDPSGVTRLTGWKGGGGFRISRIRHVAPP